MTATLPINPDKLASLSLKHGSHTSPEDGVCFMEAVAWVRDMEHTAHPKCVANTIGAAGRAFNDNLPDDATRTRLLVPLIPVVVGTVTTKADEETRAWLATDFLVREVTPAWMELAGLNDTAAKLRAAPPLTSSEIAAGLGDLLRQAQQESAAAWDAARDAAGDAAWDAAWDAARAAAWDAAWAAAWDAARDAAGAAARDAAGAAARAAARAAAPTDDARYAAAKAKLQPTADTLNEKCVDLIRRMAAVGR